MRDPETAEYAERARGGKSDREVMKVASKRYVAEAYRALMHRTRSRPGDSLPGSWRPGARRRSAR